MQGSDEIYEEMIGRLDTSAPSVAAQIREEVTRGRLVKGSKLPPGERQDRQLRLSEHKLGRISDDEMAVMPYNSDQRLALLCETLLTLAETMAASRREVITLAVQHGVQSSFVEFVEPDEADSHRAHIDLGMEAVEAERTLAQVRDLLGPVSQELGTWQ